MPECEHCNIVFTRTCDLTRHQNESISCRKLRGLTGVNCAKCNATFPSRRKLEAHRSKCQVKVPELVERNAELRKDYRERLELSAKRIHEEREKHKLEVEILKKKLASSVEAQKKSNRLVRELQHQADINQTVIKVLKETPRTVNNNITHTGDITNNYLILQGSVADLTSARIVDTSHMLTEQHLLEGSPGLVTFLLDAELLTKVEHVDTVNYYKSDSSRDTYKFHGSNGQVIVDIQAASLRKLLGEKHLQDRLTSIGTQIVNDAHTKMSPQDALCVTDNIANKLGECRDLEKGIGRQKIMKKLSDISTPVKNLKIIMTEISAPRIEFNFVDAAPLQHQW